MNKIQFQQILKTFYKNSNEIICKNPRYLPTNYSFDDLKKYALKLGYNYKLDSNGTLIIKLTSRQESELKLLP